MSDVVVRVEITPALVVVKILHLAAHDVYRLLVSDTQIAPEQTLSSFYNGVNPCHPRRSVVSNNRGKVLL